MAFIKKEKIVLENSDNRISFFIFCFFLLLAFIQCYKSVLPYSWGYDIDNYRDMANIETILSGNYGKDPSYLNEYLWYNPLIYWMESLIVKITGLPVNLVITKCGVYLNFLSPVLFFVMLRYFFNSTIALAATAAYLFFTANNLPGWAVATYSPWVFAATLTQPVFYYGMVVLHKACVKESLSSMLWFGFITGFCFLGHTAPTIILLLIMLILTLQKLISQVKLKQFKEMRKLILTRAGAAIVFIITSLPLTYYIIGKYNLDLVNKITYEYINPLFAVHNFFILIQKNLSVSLFISIVGLIYFIFGWKKNLKEKMIFYWLIICVVFYIHSVAVSFLAAGFNIHLFGTVPSHHYFFYLKALQAVFFGIGLYALFFKWLPSLLNKINPVYASKVKFSTNLFLVMLVLLVIVNYPSYSGRFDFANIDKKVIELDSEKWRYEAYFWIMKNTDINDVFLAERELCDLPVLASGRKMVAVSATFSNAYIDYDSRNADRNYLLESLLKEKEPEVEKMLNKYRVQYLVIRNNEIPTAKCIACYFPESVFKGSGLSIYKRQTE